MITEQEINGIVNELKNIRANVAVLMRGIKQIEEYLENKLPKKEDNKNDV